MEEEDDDMETDMSVLPKGHRVNPLAGTKRSREHCDEDECKKSRKDGMSTTNCVYYQLQFIERYSVTNICDKYITPLSHISLVCFKIYLLILLYILRDSK